MDFRYLVENGTYSRDNLTAEQKAFIRGLEVAREELDYIVDPEDEKETTIERIVREVKEAAIEEAKEYIYTTICEQIIFLTDENIAEKDREEMERGD